MLWAYLMNQALNWRNRPGQVCLTQELLGAQIFPEEDHKEQELFKEDTEGLE